MAAKFEGQIRVCIPALERDNYRDLCLLEKSFYSYHDSFRTTLEIFYKGHHPQYVRGKAGIHAYYFEHQSDANRHFGCACAQIMDSVQKRGTEDDVILFLNDDTVIVPEMFVTLREDLEALKEYPVGLLGLRSNFVAGAQNIRNPYGQLAGIKYACESNILQTYTVFGVAFATTLKTLNSISRDWTKIQWYGDNLLSHDLIQSGKQNFVSRAYVHHHGSQSGTDYAKYDADAKEWLKVNRPDFVI